MRNSVMIVISSKKNITAIIIYSIIIFTIIIIISITIDLFRQCSPSDGSGRN